MGSSQGKGPALFLATLFLAVLSSHWAHGEISEEEGVLSSYPLMGRLEREFSKLELKLSLPLIDFEVLEGVDLGFRYELESYPTGFSNQYTRIDRYRFNVGIDPGAWIEDLSSPIGFRIRKGSELYFARQFSSQKEALLQKPYHYPQIPINARIAREQLNPGDFVAFKADLSFLIRLYRGTYLHEFLRAYGSTHALLRGEFLVHIFRMEEDRLRIKFFALRGRQAGIEAGLGVSPDLEIFGINVVDRRIRRVIELSSLKLDALANVSDLFLVDYVFDLRNQDAIQAYDDLMLKKLILKDLALSHPWKSRRDLGHQLLTDLEAVENIYLEDLELPIEQRRIVRLFQGANTISAQRGRQRIGAYLASYTGSLAHATNHLLSFKSDQEFVNFIFKTYEKRSRVRFLFNLFGSDDLIRSGLLLAASPERQPERFLAFVAGREREFKNLTERRYRQLRRYVQTLLPRELEELIEWPDWDFSEGKVINVFFQSEIFLNPESFFLGESYSRNELAAILRSTLREMGRPKAQPQGGSHYHDGGAMDWIEEYESDIWAMVDYLSVIFSRVATPQVRYRAYLSLRSYDLFHEVGAHYLIRLIPPEKYGEVLKYNLVLVGEGQPDLRFFYGEFSQEKIYQTLLYIQDIIANRKFSLRHYIDENGEYRLPQNQIIRCCEGY